MCPTTLGRVQTRVAILVGPAILGLLLSLLTGNIGFIVTIAVFLLMGVALDTTLYAFVIRWQPPWLTGVLAVGEFVILAVLLNVLQVSLTFPQAALFYWVSWILAVLTRIIVLPLSSLAWLENGGEFRETGWSIPLALEPLPVIALVEEERPYGALVREFSTVRKIPEEIRNLPSPSGVHRIPSVPPPSQS
jgi:hypothetical protein